MGPLTIASIYKPIEQEMVQVEEKLNRAIKTAPPEMTEQLNHALKDGGKRIRPALTLLAGKFYHPNLDLLLPMATAVEMAHTATLTHDDTIDNSHLRRGKPTINHLWGNFCAVLLGDYLLAASAHMAAETDSIQVMRLFAQTIMTICRGEIEESLNLFNQSREHYFQRISNKTASLFSFAAESGAVLSEAPDEAVQSLKSYGYNLGMGFQIVDDILDFVGQEETVGKPVAADLLQGIFTLPVILLLEDPKSQTIKEILAHDEEKGAKLVMEMVHNSPVLEECYHIARGFCSQACLALDKLPRNVFHDSLTDLTDYVIRRKS